MSFLVSSFLLDGSLMPVANYFKLEPFHSYSFINTHVQVFAKLYVLLKQTNPNKP